MEFVAFAELVKTAAFVVDALDAFALAAYGAEAAETAGYSWAAFAEPADVYEVECLAECQPCSSMTLQEASRRP